MNPKIAIGCPVRNRSWVLPEYLAALERIDHRDKLYLFLENDSTDDSWDILDQFSRYGERRKVHLHTMNTGESGWDRGDYSMNQYANLAGIRNRFLELFLETNADYLLSVDSDIIVPHDIVNRLLEHSDEITIIGAAISNIPGQPLDGSTPGNFMVENNGMVVHPNPYPLAGVLDVDVVGAVYLIPRKVLEAGVRYGPHPQGEDIAFCQQAKEKGYRLRVMLDLQCEHRMTKDEGAKSDE